MENEIKVGEYVRDREGNITKIIGTLSLFKDVELYLGEDGYQYSDNAIVKHSTNLIDLIQCGDYVNGILVTGKESTLLWTEIKGIDRSGYHIPISQYGENIKTIVTKEQFESISYKVTKM